MKTKKLFSILLTLAMLASLLPVSVIPAYATTQAVTKTVTWKMDGGASGSTTLSSDSLELFSSYEGANQTLRYTSTDSTTPIIFSRNSDKMFIFLDKYYQIRRR